MKIELVVRNSGHVPSFKNNKRSILLKSGALKSVTDRKTKQWMERCIQSFESQLLCALRTTEGATPTEHYPRSLIASLLPQDDSRQWIPELHIYCKDVDRGEEGATIIIEKL